MTNRLPEYVPPTFAEQVVTAIDELVDAKIEYAHSRRGRGGDYASLDAVYQAQAVLTTLLGRVAA